MQIVELRTEMGLSLEAFAALIGLQSRGRMSVIEREGRCALGVALKIEALSMQDGEPRIDAADLNDDVRASRQGVSGGGGAVHGEANSPAALAPATGQIGDLSGPFDGAQGERKVGAA